MEPLSELQQRMDQSLHSALSFPLEARPFTPHLTLGRLHDRTTAQNRRRFGQAMAGAPPEAQVSWQVAEVQLIRSTLAPRRGRVRCARDQPPVTDLARGRNTKT